MYRCSILLKYGSWPISFTLFYKGIKLWDHNNLLIAPLINTSLALLSYITPIRYAMPELRLFPWLFTAMNSHILRILYILLKLPRGTVIINS
jgi:hypothetical protein